MPLGLRAAHWTWVTAVAACLAGTSATAQERTTARLHYDRDANAGSCPDEQELRDLVSARLGYVPFRDESPLAIEVVIRSAARNLEARVSVREEQAAPGVRVLQSAGRDCVELSQALALAISVAIDPMSLMSPTPTETATAPVETPPHTPPDRSAPTGTDAPPTPAESAPVASANPTDTTSQTLPPQQPTPTQSGPETPHTWLGLLGEGQLGTLPQLAPALTLAAEWQVASAPVGLRTELGWVAPETRGGDQGSVHAWRLDARALGCAGAKWWSACAGLAAGVLSARGQDIDPARTQTTWTAALAAELGARVLASERLGLELRAGVDVPLRRVVLELNQQAVWTASPLGLRMGVGVSWGFL